MDKREEVLDVTLVARAEAPKVLQPREEELDVSAAAVPAELAAISRDFPARRAVRGEEFDAALRKPASSQSLS